MKPRPLGLTVYALHGVTDVSESRNPESGTQCSKVQGYLEMVMYTNTSTQPDVSRRGQVDCVQCAGKPQIQVQNWVRTQMWRGKEKRYTYWGAMVLLGILCTRK